MSSSRALRRDYKEFHLRAHQRTANLLELPAEKGTVRDHSFYKNQPWLKQGEEKGEEEEARSGESNCLTSLVQARQSYKQIERANVFMPASSQCGMGKISIPLIQW